MTTGALIVEARHAAGLTQVELARRAGTSQAAIARYESDVASPSVSTLERVLKAAGRQLDLRTKPSGVSDLSSAQAVALRRHRKEITEILRAAGATNPRVFGSVARGTARPLSDIDLLVTYDSAQRGLLPIVRVNDALTRLVGYAVEVAPEDMLRPEVKADAVNEAVPL